MLFHVSNHRLLFSGSIVWHWLIFVIRRYEEQSRITLKKKKKKSKSSKRGAHREKAKVKIKNKVKEGHTEKK